MKVYRPLNSKTKNTNFAYILSPCLFCMIVLLVSLAFRHFLDKAPVIEETSVIITNVEKPTSESIITDMAESLQVPVYVALKLSEVLTGTDPYYRRTEYLKGESGGLGLYAINSHFLANRIQFYNLEDFDVFDPVANSYLALSVLRDIYEVKKSWREACIIYIYGYQTFSDTANEMRNKLDF